MTLARILLIFLSLSVTPDLSWGGEPVCSEHYAKFMAQLANTGADSARYQKFLEDFVYPVVGRRLYSNQQQVRRCQTERHCISFPESSTHGKELRILWSTDLDSSVTEPWIDVTHRSRTLVIPQGVDFNRLPEKGRAYIQQLLLGSDLHPYNVTPAIRAERSAMGESPIFLKSSQTEALKEIQAAIDSGKRKIELVAPAGWGKTEVLKNVLDQRLDQGKLHIITSDQIDSVEKIESELRSSNGKRRFKILFWGGTKGERSLHSLLEEAEDSSKPIVLITTTRSLKSAIEKDQEKSALRELIPQLGTVIYDEGKFVGSLQNADLLSELVDDKKSKAVLLDLTRHTDRSKSSTSKLHERSIWANLKGDSPRGGFQDTLEQLSQGIQRGEATPIHQMQLLTLQSSGIKKSSFFKRNENGQTILDPEILPTLLTHLRPRFIPSRNGLISVGSVQEAELLETALKSALPDRRPAIIHSNMNPMTREWILRDYRAGKYTDLISVRGRDEDFALPRVDFYIDLTQNSDPRSLLERLGRVLSLEPGKDRVDVVSLVELDREHAPDYLRLVDSVLEGKLTLPTATISEEARANLNAIQAQLAKTMTGAKIPAIPPLRQAAIALAKHLRDFKSLPTSGEHSALYEKIRRFRKSKEADFDAAMREEVDIYPLYRQLIKTPEQRTADDLAVYLEKHKTLEGMPDRELGLYSRLITARKSGEFSQYVKEHHPELHQALAQFSKKTSTNFTPDMTADEAIAHVSAHGTLAGISASNRNLYRWLAKHRNHPKFIERISKDPRALEEFRKWEIANPEKKKGST